MRKSMVRFIPFKLNLIFVLFAELVEQEDKIQFALVLQKLIDLEIPGLPPGGGIAAK